MNPTVETAKRALQTLKFDLKDSTRSLAKNLHTFFVASC